MKILVVDDSRSIRQRVRQEFEPAGHVVLEAASGEEALALLVKERPQVITMDIDMPGMSGFEACARIRKGEGRLGEFKRVPIVFLSGQDSRQSRFRGYEVGANGFVVKPFLKGELAREVEDVFRDDNSFTGCTVLVVDDSPTVRSYLKSGLGEQDIRVVEAEDGLEALERLREDPARFDLAIVDYIMPRMNGEELFYAIRRDLGLRDLPVLFLSAYDEKDFMLRMFKAGAADYLIKPFSKEELQARVNVHLRSKILGDRLREKVVDLKREHKMKDELISICSHDLRAPLNGVVGFTNILLMDDLDEEQRDSLAQIKSSGEFMLSIINDILELDRLESDNCQQSFAETDLRVVVESCLATLRHVAAPKGIRLRLEDEIGSEVCRKVNADANGLKRLFNNLLSNSIKFSHPHDEISVRLASGPGSTIEASVIDHGIGIPADKLPLIFDMGSKGSQTGTSGEQSFGLGMSIVKRLVQQHEGKISIESEPGKGTTVKVALPARRES